MKTDKIILTKDQKILIIKVLQRGILTLNEAKLLTSGLDIKNYPTETKWTEILTHFKNLSDGK